MRYEAEDIVEMVNIVKYYVQLLHSNVSDK